MTDVPHSLLIDRIYEASFLTERWAAILDDLCHLADCKQALLFANDGPSVGRYIANAPMVPTMKIYMEENWAERDVMTARSFSRREPAFITTYDLFAEGEFEKEPAYEGFYQRCGIGSSVGTVITAPEGDVVTFGLHRKRDLGRVDPTAVASLDALRPHLARAAITSGRLRLEQARAALEALTLLRLPACAVTLDGRMPISNALMESLIPSVLQDRSERLVFVDTQADRLFFEALAGQRGVISGRQGKTFPVKADSSATPHVAHLMPIGGESRDIFASAQWLLMLAPVRVTERIDFSLIESLFDFTAAEAAVAGHLLTGKTLNQIAIERRVSPETVRVQVRTAMQKTGTNRQVDLVRVLSASQKFSSEP